VVHPDHTRTPTPQTQLTTQHPLVYQVAGWVTHLAEGYRYWAEFGYYPTREAAEHAAKCVAYAGCSISIFVERQTVATYEDGALVTTDA